MNAIFPGFGADSPVTTAAIKARRRAQARADRQGVVPAAVLADLATAEAMRKKRQRVPRFPTMTSFSPSGR